MTTYDIPQAWRDFLEELLIKPFKPGQTEDMKKFWTQLQKNGGKSPKVGPLLFKEPPPGAPETFPFISNLAVKTYPDMNGNIGKMDGESQLWYMFNLVKSMSHNSNLLGTTIAGLIADNRRPDNMYPQKYLTNLDGELAYGDLKRRLKRKSPGTTNSILFKSYLVRGALIFKIDRRSFKEADYDATKLIKSAAKFDFSNKEGSGAMLQGYHKSLITRAQHKLTSLCKEAHGQLGQKQCLIRHEWKNLANKVNCGCLGRWDVGHRFVTTHKFSKLDKAKFQQLNNSSYKWTMSDYALFDVTIEHLDEANFIKFSKWGRKEKIEYQKLCMNFFIKPDDIMWTDIDSNPLEVGTINDCISISKRQKMQTLETIDEYNDDTETEEESVQNPESTEDENTGSETESGFTNIDLEDPDPDGAVPLSSDENYSETDNEQKDEEVEREADNQCRKKIDKRFKTVKAHLKFPSTITQWYVDVLNNAVATGTVKYSINEDGMKNLLTTGNESEGTFVCRRNVRTYFEEKANELVRHIQEQKDKLDKAYGDEITKQGKSLLENLKQATGNEKKKKIIGEWTKSFPNRFFDLFNQRIEQESVIVEKTFEALKKKQAEKEAKTTIKFGAGVEKEGGMVTYKSKDGKYILRYIDSSGVQVDHFNFMSALQKAQDNGAKFPHIPETTFYQSWKVVGPKAVKVEKGTSSKTLVFENNSIPVSDGKNGVYIQEIKGKAIQQWIEDMYYKFDGTVIKDRKKIVSFKTQKGQSMISDEVEEQDKKRIENIKIIVNDTKKALDEFHTLGFLHRDVKVENLTYDESLKRVYIIDFDAVIKMDDKDSLQRANNQVPMANGEGKMDRFPTKIEMKKFLQSENKRFADYHQAGMALLQLGGVFDWVHEYNWDSFKDASGQPTRPHNDRKSVFNGMRNDSVFATVHIVNFWERVLKDWKADPNKEYKGTFLSTNKDKRRKRARQFINMLRNAKTAHDAFNMPPEIIKDIANKYFKTDDEIYPEFSTSPVTSPAQFMSQQRQPVFDKITLESEFDDSDLDALMELDPLDDLEKELAAELGEDNEDTRSHLSDAEFERMLHENSNYDALSEHIARENKAYSDNSSMEEDSKSIHSEASAVSVASQMSNVSAVSAMSNASNSSTSSAMSNLSASSEHSNVSDMSHHSYASNNSIESEEHYPTSEQSYHLSEVSYNQSSDSYNSGGDSSSGKDMGYGGLSESSDHESSNESLGYSSSGASSHRHSYNSSSDTE